MWPECACPVSTKATKKTRTESRTAEKGQKKERPRVPHKAKVSEPLTVVRSPHNQRTTPGARCQGQICSLGTASPPWGTEGGKFLILSGGRSFGGKACGHASGSTPQRRTKVKAAQRRRRRLGLDFWLPLWQSPRVAPSQRPEGGQRARLSIVRSAHHR